MMILIDNCDYLSVKKKNKKGKNQESVLFPNNESIPTPFVLVINTTSPIIAAIIIIYMFTGNSGVVVDDYPPDATTSKLAFSTNSPVG
jgi:hypothetical protein